MLSCHNEKHLNKIPSLDADCIMLNLEDGVSEEKKPLALKLCCEALEKYTNVEKLLVVRVNSLDEGGVEEIEKLNSYKPDAFRVPKIRTVEDVELALELIDDSIGLHLSIETKEAWLNLKELAKNKRVTTLYLGILDLLADLKLPHSLIEISNPTIEYILTHFLITSHAIGVKPVSFVFQEYKNESKFAEWLELESRIGFSAKGCISPSQVIMVNKAFGISKTELRRAEEIVKAFELNSKNGITGFVHEKYGFIDEPIYKGALNQIKR